MYNGPAEQLPSLRVHREIAPDMCRVVYTFVPKLLDALLQNAKISRPDQLPEAYLRELCDRASAAGMAKQIDKIAEDNPDGVAMVVGTDASGNNIEMHSADVGYDMLKRFAPAIDPALELRCDPTYSPVEFELRVFDMGPDASKDPAQNLGSVVLSTTLYPPNLA